MKRIELYDRYIFRQMSEQESNDFSTRLQNDEDLASDFRVYFSVVSGICREGEQDDMDFQISVRRLTRDQLLEIMGPRHPVLQPMENPFKRQILYGTFKNLVSAAAVALVFMFRQALR